jgi:ankyrin repeat protein
MTFHNCKSILLIAIFTAMGCTSKPLKVASDARILNLKDSTNLIDATFAGDLKKMAQLLQQGKDINERNSQGINPLMVAARKCNMTSLKWLIEHKADVTLLDAESSSPVHFATLGNCPAAIELLTKAGTPIDAKDGFDLTALMLAVRFGNVETVKAILQTGANLNIQDAQGWAAIHYAALRGRVEILDALIDKGPDLEVKTLAMETPLMIALQERQKTLAQRLIDSGAKVSQAATTEHE